MREIMRQWVADQNGIDDSESFVGVIGAALGFVYVQLSLSYFAPSALDTFAMWMDRMRANPLEALHAPFIVWLVLFLHIGYTAVGMYLGHLVAPIVTTPADFEDDER